MLFYYFIIFLFVTTGSWLLSLAVRRFASAIGALDGPTAERKHQTRPIPVLGGLAIFGAFFVGLWFVRGTLLSGDLEWHHWAGFLAGGLIIMIGGFLDDRFGMQPRHQIWFPVLAALSVILGGVSIAKLTNPLGGYLPLDALSVSLPVVGTVGLISAAVIFVWLMGMMYTTKLLDGVDGLVGSVTAIGSLTVFLFTITTRYYQPDIGLAALILAAACVGFLALNWQPASLYLGEGGSLFLGYALGVLAIISGGKIAITLLVMGFPILDVAWTIVRRLRSGRNPFTFADREHLHFRLLDRGLNPWQVVAGYVAAAAAFGLVALFLQSMGKLIALGALVVVMLVMIIILDRRDGGRKLRN